MLYIFSVVTVLDRQNSVGIAGKNRGFGFENCH